MNKSIYLAGPIAGLTYKGCTSWREEFYHFFKKHDIDAYSPMRGKIFLEEFDEMEDAHDAHFLSSQKTITLRDRNDATTCNLLIANFKGARKTSIGTCIELGWADANQIPIIAIIDEVGIHDHAILKEISIVVETLEQAKILALQILSPKLELPKI